MSFFKKLFGSKNEKTPESTGGTSVGEQARIEGFKVLKADDRMGHIMMIGGTGEHQHFAVMRYAILEDKDQHVNFAALKRIHNFKSHPQFSALCTQMQNLPETEHLEPYFSFALRKLDIITEEELNQRMNRK